jgi:toxin ParE1/3/4
VALRYTEQARSDLIGIHHAISDSSPSSANMWVRRITDRCLQLVSFPLSGPVRPKIAPDACVLVIKRWVITYRLLEDGPQIVRIIDGARDLSGLDLPLE